MMRFFKIPSGKYFVQGINMAINVGLTYFELSQRPSEQTNLPSFKTEQETHAANHPKGRCPK